MDAADAWMVSADDICDSVQLLYDSSNPKPARPALHACTLCVCMSSQDKAAADAWTVSAKRHALLDEFNKYLEPPGVQQATAQHLVHQSLP